MISKVDWDSDRMFTVEAGLTHYLDQLQTYLFDGLADDSFETESGAPFCGCDTCFTREVMAFLVPRIYDLVMEGSLWAAKD